MSPTDEIRTWIVRSRREASASRVPQLAMAVPRISIVEPPKANGADGQDVPDNGAKPVSRVISTGAGADGLPQPDRDSRAAARAIANRRLGLMRGGGCPFVARFYGRTREAGGF